MPNIHPVAGATSLPSITPLPYAIYALTERGTERHYVGLTARTLPQRISAHLSQARRDRHVHADGLMASLRRTLDAGRRFQDDWTARIFARVATPDEAREAERYWITTLSAASPIGFNLMPGGSSVGGPGNAVPVTIILPDGSHQFYASIQDAIVDGNKVCRRSGLPTLLPGTAYARLAMGWSAAEALGYARHEDGRGARPPVLADGQMVNNLRTVSAATGVSVAALRSRLHRRTQSGSKADLISDMRCSGLDQLPRRAPPLGLRLPGMPGMVSIREYAKGTNTPAATIQHRFHAALRAGLNPAKMSPADLLEFLVTGKDRRRLLTLYLPDGRCLTGGERELIRQVLGDHELAAGRAVPLSESGIRRRLRLLAEADRQDPGKVMDAFGFDVSGGEV